MRPAKRKGRTPLRVLIAEDSEDDAALLVHELRRGGFEPVYELIQTPEAMERALTDSEWDVIVSDYRMPRFDALQALDIFRRSGSEIPFIVVSGQVGEETAVEVMRAGAHDFLTKDSLARLCPAVERSLEEVRERREHRSAAQALRETEERYRVVAETASDAIVMIDASSQVLFVNEPAEQVFGYSREEMLGNKLTMLMPDRLRSSHETSLKRYLETDERRVNWKSLFLTGLHKSGREIPLEVSFGEHTRQGKRFFTGFIRDITERQQAQRALEESEERYSLVVEGSNDGIFDWNIRTGDLYWNDRMYEMFGLSRLEVTPSFDFFIELLHPEDRQRVQDAVSSHLEHGYEYNQEFRMRHSSGEWVHCIGRGRAQRDEHDIPVRMAGAVTDITDLKRFEEDLRRRDAILEAVRFAAERFLTDITWEESIQDVLERLGIAAEVSRVYIFENRLGEDGEVRGSHRYEWVAPGITPHMDNPLLEAIPYQAAGFGRWVNLLGSGEMVYGHARDFPETELPVLREQDILSIIVVPVSVEGEWWGLMGFDACLAEREWTPTEMDALRAAANTLGAAVQRRKIEEELRASEAELRALFEAMADPIFVYDSEGRHLKVANLSLQYRTAEELLGHTLHEVLPKEQADGLLENIRCSLETRQATSYEYDLSVGGQQKWFEAAISPMMEDSVVMVARDITGRKHSERELGESEERFRTLTEAAFEGIVIAEQGMILEVSTAYANIFGYERSELLGTPVLEHIAPESRELVESHIAADYEEAYELVGLKKDGTRFYLEAHGRVSTYQNRPVRMTAVRDITERKEAERALREAEERYRTLVEQMPAITYVSTQEPGELSKTTYISPQVEEILGYTQEEYLQDPIFWPLHPEDRERVSEEDKRTGRTGEPFSQEYRMISREGDVVWILDQASLVFDDEGLPKFWLGVLFDITGRKRSEEALVQSEQLYRAVMEQATENICLVDVETGRIVESNPAFRTTLGYDEAELGRMTLYDIVAHDRQSVEQNVRLTLEQGHSFVGQREYRRKDGSLVDVEASGSIILRNSRTTLCVVAHDVTERVRAQRMLEERLSTLSGIAANLTLDLPMENILDGLAKRAVEASTAGACAIILIDPEDDAPRLVGTYGLPKGYAAGLHASYRAGAQSFSLETLLEGQPTLIPNIRELFLNDPLYAPIHDLVREVPWEKVLSVPLVFRGRTLGAINLCYLPDHDPDKDDNIFIRAVADQTAVAVENARLLVQARGKAILEERQRLARELHDSVSQALYGIALGTKTARNLLNRDPQLVADPLDYILSLAQAGMAEMRALIFELRPESLEREGLVAAFEKQAAALKARYKIEVETSFCDEPETSLEAKETLYRIGQEALHNTVKHARASSAGIVMKCNAESVYLEIYDDGVGFDATGDFPGHLGLRSMRERAERLGGTLEVESTPGEGARIYTQIPI